MEFCRIELEPTASRLPIEAVSLYLVASRQLPPVLEDSHFATKQVKVAKRHFVQLRPQERSRDLGLRLFLEDRHLRKCHSFCWTDICAV